MKCIVLLFLVLTVKVNVHGQSFSPLAASADYQLAEVVKPLSNELQRFDETTALLENNGQQLIFSGKDLTKNCDILEVNWSSTKLLSVYEDKISFECKGGEYREILQIRKGKNLKAFSFNNWMDFKAPKLNDLESYQLFLNWQEFQLEWTHQSDKKSLFVYGMYDYMHTFKMYFSEESQPPIRVYDFKSALSDFVLEQRTYNTSTLDTYVYYSSKLQNEATPLEFTDSMKYLFDRYANAIRPMFTPNSGTLSIH